MDPQSVGNNEPTLSEELAEFVHREEPDGKHHMPTVVQFERVVDLD